MIIAAVFTLLSIFIMAKYAVKVRSARIASLFLISIYVVTALNNAYKVMDDKYIFVAFSYVALLFAFLSPKLSLLMELPYLAHSAAYFSLAFEDSIIPKGVMDGFYYEIMYGLLAFLIISVTYDRMGTNRLGAGKALPWFSPDTHFHSEKNL